MKSSYMKSCCDLNWGLMWMSREAAEVQVSGYEGVTGRAGLGPPLGSRATPPPSPGPGPASVTEPGFCTIARSLRWADWGVKIFKQGSKIFQQWSKNILNVKVIKHYNYNYPPVLSRKTRLCGHSSHLRWMFPGYKS